MSTTSRQRPHVRRLSRQLLVATLAAGAAGAALASPAAAQRAKPAASSAVDADYRLSMANIERLVPLAKNLSALQNDPEVVAYIKAKTAEVKASQKSGSSDDEASMARVLQLLDGQPRLHAAFAAAGLTPRDYTLTTVNLGINWMAVMAEDQLGKAATAPSGVAGDNWRLVHQNRARIAQIMDELNKYPVRLSDESDEGE